MNKKLLVLALDTFTNDQVFSWPVKHLGAAVEVYGRNGLGLGPDDMIRGLLREHQPDVAVWAGVCGGESMPKAETLRSIRSQCRIIMICWDAGHKDWWGHLDYYKKNETFDLICAADGSQTPWCESFLCPINPEWYPYDESAFGNRPIDLGFMGSYDQESERGCILGSLARIANIKRRTGEPGPYRDYADFMLRCRATVNVAGCAGDQGQHVKARCVEAAWAGCMLFESKGSPLSRWVPSDCYEEYETAEDVRRLLINKDFLAWARSYGAQLHKAMQPHHPRHFWQQVMG